MMGMMMNDDDDDDDHNQQRSRATSMQLPGADAN
jgi:hypothetical protein